MFREPTFLAIFAQKQYNYKILTMRILKYICCALLIGSASCGTSTDKKPVEAILEQDSKSDEALADGLVIDEVINTVYEKFVFGIDSNGGDLTPETYFTANALKKLQEDYDFDCEDGPCYAYYALRTEMQDSNPESDGASRIYSVEPVGDGWYTVSYSDMGWPGKTRIKIVDGKIDDYQRLK